MYYAKIRGIVMGPLTEDAVREMISRGQIGRNNMMSQNKSDWFPASCLEEFFPAPLTMSSSTSAAASQFDPSSLSTNKEWYVSVDHKTGTGPYSQQDIHQQFTRNEVLPNSLVWRDGVAPVELKDSPEFTFLFPPPTPEPPFSNFGFTPGAATYSSSSAPNYDALPSIETETTPEILATIANEGTRPTAWVCFLGLIFSFSLFIFLIGSIMYLNERMDQKIPSSLATMLVVTVIVSFALQTFVLVEFWLYFAGIRTLAQRKDLDSFIVMSQRLNAFWRALAIACCAGIFISISLIIFSEMSKKAVRESVPVPNNAPITHPAEPDLFAPDSASNVPVAVPTSPTRTASIPRASYGDDYDGPLKSDMSGGNNRGKIPATSGSPENNPKNNSSDENDIFN